MKKIGQIRFGCYSFNTCCYRSAIYNFHINDGNLVASVLWTGNSRTFVHSGKLRDCPGETTENVCCCALAEGILVMGGKDFSVWALFVTPKEGEVPTKEKITGVHMDPVLKWSRAPFLCPYTTATGILSFDMRHDFWMCTVKDRKPPKEPPKETSAEPPNEASGEPSTETSDKPTKELAVSLQQYIAPNACGFCSLPIPLRANSKVMVVAGSWPKSEFIFKVSLVRAGTTIKVARICGQGLRDDASKEGGEGKCADGGRDGGKDGGSGASSMARWRTSITMLCGNILVGFGGMNGDYLGDMWVASLTSQKSAAVKRDEGWHPATCWAFMRVIGDTLYLIGGKDNSDVHSIPVEEVISRIEDEKLRKEAEDAFRKPSSSAPAPPAYPGDV